MALSTLTSFLVAIIAGGATLVATGQANEKDRDIRRDTVEQSLREEARRKRETVYARFAETSNRYNVATSLILKKCPGLEGATKSPTTEDCPTSEPFNQARYEFQGTINDIYLFGTPEAQRAARRISDHLPAGIESKLRDDPIRASDPKGFSDRYAEFLTVACRDVRIDPGQPCE
ncbi:hypothetical protein [Actinokineospora xionganensis]|uniref:Secreted protein n=1 Tax=Actinokineospora xionganensis TaxID=2684470 RepID=A0ABR7LG76_9PSEU|nr:hypothetical protein [Actinokineospora xionganensis]MBC6451720.1 hypothetical protein [Actinokineospora xionganensis]